MEITYHGHNTIDLNPGDIIRYQLVSGIWNHMGTFIDILPPLPHRGNVRWIRVLTQDGLQKVNTATIFRMEKQ